MWLADLRFVKIIYLLSRGILVIATHEKYSRLTAITSIPIKPITSYALTSLASL